MSEANNNPNLVSLSSLQSKRKSNRKRKPKYSSKPWEYSTEEERKRYVAAAVRVNLRYQQIKYGSYSPDRDPFISDLSDRDIYELQLNAILPIQYNTSTERNSDDKPTA